MATRETVLRDPRLDRRLARHGFVTLPALIDASTADALRREYLAARGDGDGFVPDLLIADRAYRRWASTVLGDALDAVAADLFVDHVPFLRSFLCKYPGGASDLYLHQDWMYVDERDGGRTFVVWIALEDIDGHNGQLRVLRGSHGLRAMVRGTDLVAPWMRHEELIRERLVSVPLRRGEAVVFDNALVHCSYPNHTERPRLAAAVGLRPRSAGLVHFRRCDGTRAARHVVDEDFFVRIVPEELFVHPPDEEVVEVLDVDDEAHDLDAAGLRRVLDGSPRQRLIRTVDRSSRARSQRRPGVPRTR